MSSAQMLITGEPDVDKIKKRFENGDFSKRESHRIPVLARSVWMHARLVNKTHFPLYLEFVYPLLDSITIYTYPVGDERAISTYQTGDSFPFENRALRVYNCVVPVQVTGEAHVFVHVQSAGHLNPNFKIWLSPERIYQKNLGHYLFFGIYFGVMIAMIFYNLFLFINIKDITYLYYVLYITAFLCSAFIYYGFSSPVFFHHDTYWPQVLINLFFPATGVFFILFSKHYLNTRQFTPRLDACLNGFIILLLVQSAFFYVKSLYTFFNFLIGIMAFVLPVIIFFLACYLFIRFTYKPAVYYLIAIISLGIFFFLSTLAWWLQLQNMILISYGIPIGSALDVILFSIGLSDKINTYRKEKEQIQNDIIKIQATTYHEIEEKNKELKRLDTVKDEFLANTTHEIKTPLHAMIGMVDFLLDEDRPCENHEHCTYNLRLIKLSANRLSLILNDILDYSKMKVSQIRLNLEPVNIREIAESVVYMSRFLAMNKPIDIHNRINGHIPHALADKNRIHQVIHNLMQNALTYTREGSIDIAACTVGNDIVFSITDTGIGIDEAYADRIFESFENAGNKGGTGLGLSITKNLVSLHGGRLWVERNRPHGSIFKFTLPMADTKPLTVDATPRQDSANTRTATVSIADRYLSQGGPTILAVDDEIVNLHVLSSMFKDARYNVLYCLSGKEALERVENHKPDLILLDIMMPDMDGYEVAAAIREAYTPLDIPIIFLSVKNQEKDIVKGLTMGGNDYMAKPFSKGELLARIENLLSIKQLVSNSDLLHDLYILSSNNILFINTENRIPYLYTSLTEMHKRKQLLSTLSALKTFYGEDRLLQINRSCMINPAKVTNVLKHKLGNNVKYQVEIGGQIQFPLTQTHLPGFKSLFPDYF